MCIFSGTENQHSQKWIYNCTKLKSDEPHHLESLVQLTENNVHNLAKNMIYQFNLFNLLFHLKGLIRLFNLIVMLETFFL